jgi:hypothetical protein
MNTIQTIENIVLSFILVSSIIIIISGCVCFLQHQNLDNYFLNEDIYDLSDELYLIKNETNICGKKYLPGDIISKESYNYCKK